MSETQPFDINEKPQAEVNDRCVATLARALAAAKRGEYLSCAVIVVDPNGDPMIMVGGRTEHSMAINFGLDMVKAQMMDRTSAPSSPIIDPTKLQA